jgi:drug/metabolite transporter (DMT)-like permease
VFIVLLIALAFESLGVVLLAKGLKVLEGPSSYTPLELSRVLGRIFTNKYVLLGVFFEALFFGGFLYLLSQKDVSFVWPLTSLTFLFSALMAKYYLNEEISVLRWTGVILIVVGAGCITYSEKNREGNLKEKSGQIEKN